MSIKEGAYPGKEMTSRRIPTRVEEFFASFAHQLLLLAILFVCLFMASVSFMVWDDAVVLSIMLAPLITLLVCLAGCWEPFRRWVGEFVPSLTPEGKRIQELVNRMYSSWRDGSVPAQVGLVGEARRTPQQDAALKAAFDAQRGSLRRISPDDRWLRQELAKVDARERLANQRIPELILYFNETEGLLWARFIVWLPMQPEQVVAAIPDLERAWGVCIGDSESSGGEVWMPIYLRERAGWER